MKDRAETLRQVIQAALDQGGVDAVVELVCRIIYEFESRIAAQDGRIVELERRLNSNSNKQPSSDGHKRKTSLRKNYGGRKPGCQPGHSGQTLLSQSGRSQTLLRDEQLHVNNSYAGD